MKKQIDILLATYNGEKYLREQIDSILNQTYQNIQLIISDDCSEDDTRTILKEYEKKDSRVQVYYQEKNLGCVENFEFLLKQVKNEIFMLSDQDDVWMPEKIEKTYECLIEQEADLVFGDLEIVDENLKTMHSSFNDFMKLSRKIKKYMNTYRLNYLYNCITGCTIMVKQKWVSKILPLPKQGEHILHDYWIGLIISLKGKIAYLPNTYIKYRQHNKNEIGIEKATSKIKEFDQIRELLIQVKLDIFGWYVENNEKFPENLKKLNIEVYEYFKMIEKKRNFNWKRWHIFYELYRTETFLYYMENFIIMNLPWIGRILFRFKK